MSIMDGLITNRTAMDVSDVTRLAGKAWSEFSNEERDAWNAGMKGAYNSDDLNRVTAAMEYLDGRLSGLGYATGYKSVEVEPGRTTWQDGDWTHADQMQAYLDNARALRSIFNTAVALPNSMRKISVEDANHLEQLLVEIETTIDRVIQALPRCGTFMFRSGVRPLPSAQSDLGRTWDELDAKKTTWANWAATTWYALLYGDLTEEA